MLPPCTRRLTALGLALIACDTSAPEPPASPSARPAIVDTPSELPAPALPAIANGPYAPSEARPHEEQPPSGEELADVDGCARCHPAAAEQWRTSAHAFASFNNPLYAVSVERFRAEVGKKESRFCAGCHDPALLVDGLMDSDIDTADARANTGVSCRVCHGIEETRPGGNAGYTLKGGLLDDPDPLNPRSVAAHRADVAIDSDAADALCATCHEAFLGPHTGHPTFLSAADDVTPWRRSAYGGNMARRVGDSTRFRSCTSCHMVRSATDTEDAARDEDGKLASHHFVGAHTYLAAMRKDDEGVARIQDNLRDIVTVDVAGAVVESDIWMLPVERLNAAEYGGRSVRFDVVLSNEGVGHHFPGGTRDAQDTWLEVRIETEDGELLAAAGDQVERDDYPDRVHRLKAEIIDEHGEPLRAREVEATRAVAYDTTLAPRDSDVVSYAWTLPTELSSPVLIRARLWHRARPAELAAATCEAPSGLLDPCVEQPSTLVAESVHRLTGLAERPEVRRFANYARGMLHAVQERSHEAERVVNTAMELLQPGSPSPIRAEVLALAARAAIRAGRTEDALARLDQLDAVFAGLPSSSALRGRAFADVWRFGESIAPLRKAAAAATTDDDIWAQLARSLASAGHHDEALVAAEKGLQIAPRHPDLLRVQALSLRRVSDHAVPESAGSAWRAFLDHRRPDAVPALRSRCSSNVPGCARERVPVHVHQLQSRAK